MTNRRRGLPIDELRKLLPDARKRLRQIMRETRRAILTPQEIIPADQWIESNCELSSELSDQGGYIRLYGYQKELVTAPFEPGVRMVVVPKSARVGFSLLAACLLAYVAAHRKFDAFLSQPVSADAHEFHDDFLSPLITSSRSLSVLKRVPTRGSIMDRWNKMRLTTGAAIRLIGAKKDDSFRRFKAFLGIMDELDADGYAPAAKGGQGDKASQAERRLDSYPNSVLVMGGTPVELKTSRLWRFWLQAEQRRYFWPCLECCAEGHPDRGMQYLEWGTRDTPFGFKWSTDPETGEVSDVHYQCRHNPDHRMLEDDKAIMDAEGEWRVVRPGRRKGVRGYHIWEAYGFNPKSTWPVIVDRFLEAKRSGDMQPFVNLSMGEPFEDRAGVALEPHMLASHCRPYPAELPDEVLAVTAGIDTQEGSGKENSDGSLTAPPRHEVSIWGWGVGGQPFLLAHHVIDIDGEPFVGEAARALDKTWMRKWRKADGTELPVAVVHVDGGYAQDAAIGYVKERVELGWEVHVVRGSKTNDPHAPVIMQRKGVSKRTGMEFTWLNVRPAKDHLGRLLRVQTPGHRYVVFPEAMRERTEFFAGLLTETLRPEKKGGALRWLKIGNGTGEPWDCFVYAYSAYLRALSLFPALERLIMSQIPSPFSLTKTDADDEPEMYPGPDRSVMADKSEERGLVPTTVAKPPRTTNRAQPQGSTTAAVMHQQSAPEIGRLQRRGPSRSKRSSLF